MATDPSSPSAPPGPRPSGDEERPRTRREIARERRTAELSVRERQKARQARLRLAGFRAARACVRWLPLRVAAVLGESLGLAAYLAVPWMRRQTLANLEIAFGAERSARERRAIARACYRRAGRGMLSWMVLHRMGAERALRRLVAEPCAEAQAVFDSGRGALIVSLHAGLFDLSGAWAARHARLVAVGREADGDPATSLMIRMRSDMGFHTIERGGAREIVRAVRDGRIVAMLADQDIRRVNGAFVPFFGRLARTPIGPAALAIRLEVPIVLMVTEWRSFTTHAVRFPEVLRPREDLSPEDAVLELTARCSEAIERAIRARPADWLWMHERWRTRPEDHPDVPVWPPGARAAAGQVPA